MGIQESSKQTRGLRFHGQQKSCRSEVDAISVCHDSFFSRGRMYGVLGCNGFSLLTAMLRSIAGSAAGLIGRSVWTGGGVMTGFGTTGTETPVSAGVESLGVLVSSLMVIVVPSQIDGKDITSSESVTRHRSICFLGQTGLFWRLMRQSPFVLT
jgi:hypothetical protein